MYIYIYIWSIHIIWELCIMWYTQSWTSPKGVYEIGYTLFKTGMMLIMTPMALGLPDYLYTYIISCCYISYFICAYLSLYIYIFYPKSLCGVLVFDSVSRSSSSSSPPPRRLLRLLHTQLCHTQLYHTPLCHTHNFVTHTLSHTIFAWQAWHLATTTFVWCGRRGTCCTGLGLVARLVAVSRSWRRGTLCGRRGTWRHPPSFDVAGVAHRTLSHTHTSFVFPSSLVLLQLLFLIIISCWKKLTCGVIRSFNCVYPCICFSISVSYILYPHTYHDILS